MATSLPRNGKATKPVARTLVAGTACAVLAFVWTAFLLCCVCVQARAEQTSAQEKPEVPTPTKLVRAPNQLAAESNSANASSTWGAQACAGVGDTVSYQLKTTLPKDLDTFESYKLWFCDSLSDGLAYVPNSVQAHVEHAGGAAESANLQVSIDGQTMRVGSNNVLAAVPNLRPLDVVVVDYDCTVNPSAVCGLARGNQNELMVEYSRTSTTEQKSESVVTQVYSFGIDLHKVDADGGKDLAGACFVLQDEAGQYRTASGTWSASEDDAQVVATNDKGVASFVGLGAGTYTLTEKTAPEGYELLSAPVKVTLAPSDVETSQRTLTATAQGADATVEAVDAATGVAKVRVEDPRTGGSKTPGNTDSNNATGAGGGAGASGNASGATGTSGTSRTQLATTADPSPAAGTGLAIAAAGLVLAGVAKRRQKMSTRDA